MKHGAKVKSATDVVNAGVGGMRRAADVMVKVIEVGRSRIRRNSVGNVIYIRGAGYSDSRLGALCQRGRAVPAVLLVDTTHPKIRTLGRAEGPNRTVQGDRCRKFQVQVAAGNEVLKEFLAAIGQYRVRGNLKYLGTNRGVIAEVCAVVVERSG